MHTKHGGCISIRLFHRQITEFTRTLACGNTMTRPIKQEAIFWSEYPPVMIQHEHLAVIVSLLKLDDLDPALLRRNISIEGINLLALKGKRFTIGSAILEYTGLCHPCSFMERTLGAGGYNAVRGHGVVLRRAPRAAAARGYDPAGRGTA